MSRLQEDKADLARHSGFALRSLSRFGPLSADTELHIRTAMHRGETHPSSTELIHEGAPLASPHILLSGWAARVRLFGDGRRQILSFILPGDMFGVADWPGSRSLTAIVSLCSTSHARIPLLGDACCWHAQASDGLTFAAQQFLRLEEERLLNQLVRVGGQTAYQRVAHLLVEFYFRLKAVGFVQGASFVLPLSQETLADALGLCMVHTNRILRQLRRDRLIEVQGSILTILELDRLLDISDYRLPVAD